METKERKQWQINKVKYTQKYQHDNYKQINFRLPNKECAEFDELLKEHNMTRIEFFRNAIEQLKKTK